MPHKMRASPSAEWASGKMSEKALEKNKRGSDIKFWKSIEVLRGEIITSEFGNHIRRMGI